MPNNMSVSSQQGRARYRERQENGDTIEYKESAEAALAAAGLS